MYWQVAGFLCILAVRPHSPYAVGGLTHYLPASLPRRVFSLGYGRVGDVRINPQRRLESSSRMCPCLASQCR